MANNVTTNGGALNASSIYFNIMPTLTNFTTSGGNVNVTRATFADSGTSANTFNLNAGTGTINFGGEVYGGNIWNITSGGTTFNSNIGTTTPVGTLTVVGPTTLKGNITTNNSAITMNGPVTISSSPSIWNAGTATINTGSTVAAGTNDLTLTADDLVLGGNVSGTGVLKLQPNSTTRLINVAYGAADGTNYNLSTTEIGRLVDGWAGIIIGSATNTGTYNPYTSIWNDPVTFRSGSGNFAFRFIHRTGQCLLHI